MIDKNCVNDGLYNFIVLKNLVYVNIICLDSTI